MESSLSEAGYAIVEKFASAEVIGELGRALAGGPDKRAGRRNLLGVAEVRAFALEAEMMGLVLPILGEGARPVRGIYFKKSEGANWSVPWHQDLTIAVAERREVEGYGPWSRKEGVDHVQPLASVLERMVTVRVHLDDCIADNGALRVIPGSHLFGRIPEGDISSRVAGEVVCECRAGTALLMRPLILHASSPAVVPSHRRVVHIEYAAGELDSGLRWFEDGA